MFPNRDAIQAQIQQFLESTGLQGFIIFGWQKEDGSVDVVFSMHEMNAILAIKAISWTLQEFCRNI